MSSQFYKVGLKSVGAYQVSGTPWITGSNICAGTKTGYTSYPKSSPWKISFPKVTKSFVVQCKPGSAGYLQIAFNDPNDYANIDNFNATTTTTYGSYSTETPGHFIQLFTDTSFTFNVACKEIYIWSMSQFQSVAVVAELTNIPTQSMESLTGDGITS